MTSLKKLLAVAAVSLPLAAAAQTAAPPTEPAPPPAAPKPPAIKFKVTGDLNNRFMLYTDQAGIYSGAETIASSPSAAQPFAGRTSDETVEEMWGEIKYRLTAELATATDSVKGVYGIELGAIRFGDATRGGGYSGDGNNYETRFAYVDFGLDTAHKNRFSVGLQPFTVNRFIWSETATGVQLKGDAGIAKYGLAWMRGNEVFTSRDHQNLYADGDSLLLRGDFTPRKDVKAGVFGLYQHRNSENPASVATATDIGPPFREGTTAAQATAANSASYQLKRFGANVDYDIFNIGADAVLTFGNIFVNLDAIYQTGKVLQKVTGPTRSLDLNAFIAHADVGVNLGALKVTYTGWYATGDDNATDGDLDNFITTDVDFFDSIVLFEGGYVDDSYFTEAPHFLDKGAIFNRIGVDFKASPKLTVGGAAMYIMTAEDISATLGEDVIGTEFDAYIAYKPVPQLELAVNAGYLIAGDAMDRFELNPDGNADNDIFRATARARYMF